MDYVWSIIAALSMEMYAFNVVQVMIMYLDNADLDVHKEINKEYVYHVFQDINSIQIMSV